MFIVSTGIYFKTSIMRSHSVKTHTKIVTDLPPVFMCIILCTNSYCLSNKRLISFLIETKLNSSVFSALLTNYTIFKKKINAKLLTLH